MAGPLNRVPLGLLSFLELKSPAGRYPVQLADQIIPLLDMQMFYRPQAHRAGLSTSAAVAVNAFQGFTGGTPSVVPQGEFWYLAEYSVQMTLQTDQGITWAAAIGIPLGVATLGYAVGDFVTVPAGTTLAKIPLTTAHYEMPRILGPGMQLGFTVANLTPGAVAVGSATGMFQRLVLSG